jgi:hypothetical protein
VIGLYPFANTLGFIPFWRKATTCPRTMGCYTGRQTLVYKKAPRTPFLKSSNTLHKLLNALPINSSTTPHNLIGPFSQTLQYIRSTLLSNTVHLQSLPTYYLLSLSSLFLVLSSPRCFRKPTPTYLHTSHLHGTEAHPSLISSTWIRTPSSCTFRTTNDGST